MGGVTNRKIEDARADGQHGRRDSTRGGGSWCPRLDAARNMLELAAANTHTSNTDSYGISDENRCVIFSNCLQYVRTYGLLGVIRSQVLEIQRGE